MRSGKDATRRLLALLLGLVCLGCAGNGNRPLVSQGQRSAGGVRARAAEPAGPVAVAAPRPASPPADPTPSAPPGQPLPTADPAPAAPVVPASGPQLAPPAPPASDPPVADALADVRRLHRTAVERYAGIDSYIARVRRREQVGGKVNPEEVLAFKFRKQPWSVHFKWLNDPGKGREVVYVQGQHGGNIHTLLAAGDIPLMKGGMRISLAPNDPRVLARSRHPITEAGIGPIINRFGAVLAAQEKGDARLGTLTYLGPQQRPDYPAADGRPAPLEALEQTIPPGAEPALPRGGRRQVFFDPANGLPVLVHTRDDRGAEVEYYAFDRMMFNVKLDADDFNPDKLWRKPGSP